MATWTIVRSGGRYFFSSLVLVLFATTLAAAQPVAVFHIGNSLTDDSDPKGIEAIANGRGLDHTIGAQTRGAISLNTFAANTNLSSGPPLGGFGRIGDALPNFDWSAITLQPHRSSNRGVNPIVSTLQSDEDSILFFIDLAQSDGRNSDTTFYIYSAWPKEPTFNSTWTSTVADVDGTPTVNARQYVDHLFNRVDARTDAKLAVIPVGEVLYELGQRIDAGEVDGFDQIGDLFRDETHLTLDVGRYIAGVTTFATIYGIDPTGTTKPTGFYGSDAAFTPELYAAIHDAVWDVVSAYPQADSIFVPEPSTGLLLGLVLFGKLLVTRNRVSPGSA